MAWETTQNPPRFTPRGRSPLPAPSKPRIRIYSVQVERPRFGTLTKIPSPNMPEIQWPRASGR